MTIQLWINAIMKPRETFTAEKNKGTFFRAAVNLVIAAILSAILSYLTRTYFPEALLFYDVSISPIDPMTILTTHGISLVLLFIVIGLYYLIAKAMGGRGTYTSLLYLVSLYAVPIAALGAIPFIGILFFLYSIYLEYLAIKESQALSTGRTIGVILIPLVIIGVIVAILVASGIPFWIIGYQ